MRTYNFLFVFLILLLFSACEKVVEIDLNSSNPVLVAEGEIVAGETAQITLQYTRDYFDVEETRFEENAIVRITDDRGQSEVLTYLGSGRYQGQELIGSYNTKYVLTIKINDKEYIAETEIAYRIDSLTFEVEKNEFGGFGPGAGGDYTLVSVFPDDINHKNNFILNYDTIFEGHPLANIKKSRNNLFTDLQFANDGMIRYAPIGSAQKENTLIRATVRVVDEGVYSFYSQMNDISSANPTNSSSPYNPQSNISGDILGCFKGVSIIQEEIIITPDMVDE